MTEEAQMRPLGNDRTGALPLADDSNTDLDGQARGRRKGLVKRLLRVGVGVALVVPLALIYQPNDVVAAPTTLVVNSTLDASDSNPGDGQCATGAGTCTLRAAVQEANAVDDPNIIEVPGGTYVLSQFGAAEDAAASGDLDITSPMTIQGAGAAATIVDGNESDRVFHVLPFVVDVEDPFDVTLSGLTVRNGFTEEDGGGLYSQTGGTVILEAVTVTGNTTTSDGGGIHTTTGRLHVRNGSVVSHNEARNGGGIFNAGELNASGVPSLAVVTASTVTANTALGGGGGIWNDHEGSLTLTDVEVSDNFAEADGGGVGVVSKSALTVNGGTFSGNQAHGEGGAASTATERAVRITGTTFTGNEAGVPTATEAGEGGGGALSMGGDGVVEIVDSTFTGNSAPGEGGAIYLDNNGSVAITDSTVSGNTSGSGGGGIENAATRVTFTRLQITGNRATLDGGGIESQGSGAFTIIDTTVSGNTAENGGGFANAADGSTRIERSLFWDNRALIGFNDDTGLGGGIYSLGDADASYENVTITGNLGQVRGGGFYVDADAGVRVSNSTIVGNSSPVASGAGGEIGSINFPIQPSTSVIFRNTIVAENLLGPNCSFAIGSEGGNLQGDTSCHFLGTKDRTVTDPGLDAVADNGGPTMTMAIQPDSLALDGGVSPCPLTDQRGVSRPQNALCDSGAYESEGPFPPPDSEPPDTEYLSGPLQDTENTAAFTFTGTDNMTSPEQLLFECRLIETEIGEPPEPPDPTEPPDPALAWLGCQSPWQVPLQESGFFTFEVRAIDRAGNVDPTPAVHSYGGTPDVTPPDTFFLETPPDPSFSSSATFTVSGTDDQTPPQFMEYECRIDTLDPAAWLECANPVVFTNLTVGTHTVQARASDGADNVDPSPATYTWTIAPPLDCDLANITLGADADVYVDQESPLENFVTSPELVVRTGPLATNARTLIRFPVSDDAPEECVLESATLRLYAQSGEPGRTLQAIPLDGAWAENTATWTNQPGTTGTPASTTSGDGYREWDVTSQVAAMLDGTLANNGWQVRDAGEDDAEGAEQGFLSRETPQDPPTVTLPQLVLRFEPSGNPPPPPPPSGGPATLACGDVVTTSIVLQNDLLNCLGEGLVIGAPDIEVDLNGHTISSGAPVEPGEEDGLLAGIRNSGHSNVVIKNGTVRNFGYGVRLLAGARFGVVEGMTLEGNIIAGVELFDADDGRNGNTVRNNTFDLNGDGVTLMSGAEGNLVAGNTFNGNLGRAVYMFDSSRNRVEGNTVSGLVNDPLLDSDGGVFLEGSRDNVVLDNTISDAGDAGIQLSAGSHRNRIEANTVFRTSDSSISVADSDNPEIVDNVVHLAGGAAIALSNSHDGSITGNDARFNPGGIQLAGSNGNLVEDNDVTASQSDGITVEGGLGNEILANLANQTRGTGIAVEAEAVDPLGNPIPGNVVLGNTANNNLGDGISVSAGGHHVETNAAHNNAAWGIIAGEFVVDGGGNTASGNGEPEQCSGVVCTPGTGAPPADFDVTPPDTQILTAPPDGSSTFDPQTFTFTGSDNTAPVTALRFECRLDAPPDPEPEPPEPPEPGEPPEPTEPPASETWGECGSPWTYSLLPSGEHTFEVRAIDPFDNVDLTPATYIWTVVAAPPGPDSTPPSTTIFDAPSDPSTSTTATFGFRGSDNSTPGPNLTFQCSLDGATFVLCTSPSEYTGLPLGEHTFEVRAVDVQGNVDPTPATHTWTIVAPPADTTPPETTIDSGPDLTTVNTEATFTFSSDEEGASFECSLDGSAYAVCTSPKTYTGLTVAAHTFEVRAVDAALNVDPTPASYSWTVGLPVVDTSVSCGQVITQSVRVTNDLVDCLGDGLVVGAHGITIDLGGRTIDGTNLGFGIVNNGFDSVTVTNGTVQEFDAGVQLSNGTALGIVSSLTLRLNELAGAQLTNADDGTNGNIVRDNTVTGPGAGILLLTGTQHAQILRNTVAATGGIGVHVLNAADNLLDDNEISGSGDAALILEGAGNNTVIGNSVVNSGDASVIVHLGSNGNRIEANDLSEGEAGIFVSQSSGNELVGNVAHDNGDSGIVLEEARNGLVQGNDVRFNSGGIEMDLSTGNRIEANNASETNGTGIEVGDGSVGNVFVANIASANEAGGISVETFAAPGSGNLLDGNIADANTGDGIYVGNVGHMIRGNTANNNSEWGIYAADATVAGMNIDGGGNTATGNTGGVVDPITLLPLQCWNVVCDGGPPLASDTIPPTTAISSGPVSPTVMTSATFGFSGSDNASTITFECRLDSIDAADFAPCTSPHEYSGLALGSHTFEVRAVDFSGNVDPTPATHTWTIEAPAAGVRPDTTIDSGPDNATASTSASFTFSANEPGVTFECSLDGAGFTLCASPQSYTGLGVGAHTFEVRAIDIEGLEDLTPATYSWTITAPTVAASVSCGSLITTSTRVTNDLLDCLGTGLVIGASNITLDLDGHTIDGTGLAVGVLNNGHDNVVITNGFVQEFDFGVQLGDGTAGNVVHGLTLQLNQEAAVQLVDADNGTTGNTIRDNTLIDNEYGIWLLDGTQFALVRGNTITSSSADGIRVESSSGNRVEANTVSQSSGAGVALAGSSDNTVAGNTLSNNSAAGIAVGETGLPANDNRIEVNTLTGNSGPGISVVESSGNELVGNVATLGGGTGIELELATNTLVQGNESTGNAGGIELSGSSDNRIEANTASGNNGNGISLEGGSLRNVVLLNSVNGNSGTGIYVGDSTDAANGNLISRNIVNSNSGDGIAVNGSGHTVVDNSVAFNDGWGIIAVPGTIDGGGNEATGNSEPAQCSGVICTVLVSPGAPDTEIVDRPPDPSNSQNALFTFIGSDDTTPLFDLGFECRLDSTDPLAWVECDNPQEYFGLAPGTHTFEVRAVDLQDQVDPTPASYTWTYDPLPSGVAPDTFIDIAPPLSSPLLEGIFTFSSNEPDVTFECSLDGEPFTSCVFAYEFQFEETQVGQHTFQVRATDFEGNTDPTPATYTWTITGLTTTITDGPAFIPPEEPGEPATGGETTSTTAVLVFEANVADATFLCSLDLGPFEPCTSPVTYAGLAVGEHIFQVIATDPESEATQLEATVYEWTVTPSEDTVPPETTITLAPASGTSDTFFEFTGTDDQTQPLALTFECRLDSTDEAAWFECLSPFNLLDEFPDFAPGEHTFEVRANDNAEPVDPNSTFEGNVDPTPATHTWTSVADTTAPETTLLTTPVTPTTEPDVEFTFAGTDNATPELLLTFECSVDGGPFEPCDSPESVQGSEPGEHTFAVRTVDLALNADPTPAEFSWTLIAPPVTTITAGPADPSGTQDAAFTFSADQLDSTFACSLDGGDFLPCTSPVAYTGFTNGTHTFEVQATNTFGLVEVEPALWTWTVEGVVDTTPPQTTLTVTPAAVILVGETVFEFTSNEVGATFQCSTDGAAFQNCASPYEVSGLLDGTHTFAVQAVDTTGNVDPTPESYTWTVDLPPVAEILTGPAELTESTEATFTFAANEAVDGFECFLDGVTAPCTSPVTYTGLAIGAHVFAVRAVDDTPSNPSAFEDHDWEIVAPAPPTTSFTSGPLGVTTETTATFTFAGTDNLTPTDQLTFECSLDGAAFEPCTSPLTLTELSFDLHTLEVVAVDESGAPDPTPAIYSWTVLAPDTTAPETTITSGPAATTTSTDATLSFSANEIGATFECSVDLAAFGSCESPVVLSDMAIGTHTFAVRATDASGNTDATPAEHTWMVVADTTAPDTTITSGPSGTNTSVDVAFEFTGSDETTLVADLEFECSFDGGPFESCSSPEQIQGLTAGEHTFAVRAVDQALNVDPTPATSTWTTVDSTPPETSILSGPASPTEDTTATFTFSSDETGVTFECSLDGVSFALCSSPSELTGLTPGDHTFRVRARDAAGNADATPELYEWTVVSIDPPDTTIASGPPATTTSTDASFTFTSDQPGVSYECSLDGAAFADCETPHEIADLTVAAHELQVRAVDPAGKVDPTPAVYAWTVEAPTPPETTIVLAPPATTELTTATFTFSSDQATAEFECSLDAAAFADCEAPVELSGLALGEHTFAVRAVDLNGLADESPATHTWTVQEPAPPPVQCNTTTTTYSANADAWINQGSTSENKGDDSSLKVMSKSGSALRSLVRFGLPTEMPESCVVQSATLRLYAGSARNGRTLQAWRLNAPWTETGVTWGTQPATTGTAVTTSSGSGWRQWTVTAQVQAMFDVGANNGFLIRDANENQDHEQQFHSREKAPDNPPQLVVTYGPG
jgi:CSLREA domain-containing protein